MTTARANPRRRFATIGIDPDEPEWGPLEAVARVSRMTPELPSFHPGEFMYMYRVDNERKGLRIHLYKHIDTRRYINLDDAGHAYEYCGSVAEEITAEHFGGSYRRHRSLADGIAGLELWLFEAEPSFHRSFPPERWPVDEDAA